MLSELRGQRLSDADRGPTVRCSSAALVLLSRLELPHFVASRFVL